MAANNDNKDSNKFKEERNKWWPWVIGGIAILIILLLVFGKTSIIVADDQQPTTMDPAPMNNIDENEEEGLQSRDDIDR